MHEKNSSKKMLGPDECLWMMSNQLLQDQSVNSVAETSLSAWEVLSSITGGMSRVPFPGWSNWPQSPSAHV